MTSNNLNLQVKKLNNTHLSAANIDINTDNQIRNMSDEYLLTNQELDQLKIIYPGCKDDKALNDYRELRTKLVKAANNENFVCMVSSLARNAGTSHIAMNLAATIALDHSKTSLIIDCNSYTSGLNDYLNNPPKFGLSNFLEQDSEDIEKIIYPTGIPRLRIIPSGDHTEHAAENFSSEKMEKFIEMAKQRYPDRFIILDTPPIGICAESQILSSICDMTILVVRYGKTNTSQIQVGIDLIGREKLAGIILNDK